MSEIATVIRVEIRKRAGTWLLALAGATALALVAAPTGAQAFSVAKWEAGTCKEAGCTDAGSPSAFYTQAAGHPDFGITDFEFSHTGQLLAEVPEGRVKDVRVDLPPGLAVDPEATKARCTEQQLEEFKCPKESQVGEDEAHGTAEVALGQKLTVTEHFPVYNMVPKDGQPARFGVEINSATVKLLGLQGHLYLEGGISWHSEAETSESSGVPTGDFHEFFKIQNIPEQPEVVESRLLFWGVPQQHTGVGTPASFLTLPSTCSSRPITRLHVDSYEDPGHFLAYENETPVTATGCDTLQFNPSLTLSPESSQSDQPDGATVDLHVPQATLDPAKANSPDVQNAEIALPEGMTLDPSAAHGLQACSNEQIGIGTDNAIGCPAGSNVGSVSVDVPGIPNGSLTGNVYLGSPEAGNGPESGGQYRVFLAAESAHLGVGLRLEGRVRANSQTGRLTASFSNAPQVPFEDFRVHFNGGARAPLANPLGCGAAQPSGSITPYTGQPPVGAQVQGFSVDANGAGAGCPGTLPFAPTQAVPPPNPAQAGAYAPATLNLSRSDGQQYLSQIQATLPAGVLGAIPSVALCQEPQASEGSCPEASRVGTVTAAAGAGSEPFSLTGQAYLTGPYGGGPYGLSIVAPAVAGPYDLGNVVTRAAITVGLYSGRLTVTSTLPTIVGGIPLRLKSLSVAVNRQNFLFNPTSCEFLATESLLGSTSGATQSLSNPFQVGGCDQLTFKPSLALRVGGRTSKAKGAGIEVKLTQKPHEANLREITVQLPKQLPARLTTLQQACPAASFEVGPPPGNCSGNARVGNVTVTTPVLPDKLTGPVYLVSHGGAAFPDLDLILQGDGVEVVLVGHTRISRAGITTSSFETIPDVPVSSVVLSLPTGPRSALGANGALCGAKLIAPTTIVAQSGAKLTEKKMKIAVSGCAKAKKKHKAKKHKGKKGKKKRK